MSTAAVTRALAFRLSTFPRCTRINEISRPRTSISTLYLSFTVTAPPRRAFSLNARHIQPEPSHLPTAVSSLTQLSFVELVARTSSFLVDYYEAPTASPTVAAQLLTALQQFDVAGQQRQLKERLEGELDELVNEGKRRERRLGDDSAPLTDKGDDQQDEADHHHDDVLRVQLDDVETLEQRIIARPPLPPHLHDTDTYHAVDGEAHSSAGGGVARGKFDSDYSTDQLLVDSLPTLKEEEAVQLGRRDVMKLMAARE